MTTSLPVETATKAQLVFDADALALARSIVRDDEKRARWRVLRDACDRAIRDQQWELAAKHRDDAVALFGAERPYPFPPEPASPTSLEAVLARAVVREYEAAMAATDEQLVENAALGACSHYYGHLTEWNSWGEHHVARWKNVAREVLRHYAMRNKPPALIDAGAIAEALVVDNKGSFEERVRRALESNGVRCKPLQVSS